MHHNKLETSFGETLKADSEYRILSRVPKCYLVAANQPFFSTERSAREKPRSPVCCLMQSNEEEPARI